MEFMILNRRPSQKEVAGFASCTISRSEGTFAQKKSEADPYKCKTIQQSREGMGPVFVKDPIFKMKKGLARLCTFLTDCPCLPGRAGLACQAGSPRSSGGLAPHGRPSLSRVWGQAGPRAAVFALRAKSIFLAILGDLSSNCPSYFGDNFAYLKAKLRSDKRLLGIGATPPIQQNWLRDRAACLSS